MSDPDHRPLPTPTGPNLDPDPAWARVPFYPLPLGLALIAVAYVQTDVSVWAALRAMLVVLLGSLALLVVAVIVARGRHLGALIAAAAIVLLRTSDLPHTLVAALLLALAGGALIYFARLRRAPVLSSATRLLNIGSVALVFVLIGQAVVAGVPARISADLRDSSAVSSSFRAAAADPPDIYLLMLEDYPRADTLRRLFGFDNSAFLDNLTAYGFSVAGNSSSNYMYTSLNLAALFHMQYLADLPAFRSWQAGQSAAPSLRELINHNPVFDHLRSAGYAIFSSASRWELESVRAADTYCGAEQVNEFELQAIGDSLVGSALDVFAHGWRAGRDRSVVNAELACVDAATRTAVAGPRFVLGHIDAPHIPVVFDATGEAAPAAVYSDTAQGVRTTPEEFRRAYVAELQYLNSRVLGLVREVQTRSARPPIVIVMSDEGSESHLDWSNGANSDLQERFGTLFAASTPGHPALFGDRPLTVNVFPTLLNAYFGIALSVRTPRFFVSTAEDRLDLTETADPFAPR